MSGLKCRAILKCSFGTWPRLYPLKKCTSSENAWLRQQEEPVKFQRAEAALRAIVKEIEQAVRGADECAVTNDVRERAPRDDRHQIGCPLHLEEIIRRRGPREPETVRPGHVGRDDAAEEHRVGVR